MKWFHQDTSKKYDYVSIKVSKEVKERIDKIKARYPELKSIDAVIRFLLRQAGLW